MSDPVRVAIVGCGDISAVHFRSYAACGLKVVGMCDVLLPRAQRRKEEFKLDAPLFEDHQEMLAKVDCDLVTVATPVACHAPITINALRAGRHVACEKPSTLCIAENKAIMAEAKKAKKNVIFFSARMRWGGATMARQFINDGELGDIYRAHVQFFRRRGRPGVDMMQNARWFVDKKQAGGGIIMDMGQYYMDMLFDLTGWPEIISATGATFRGFPHDLPEGLPMDVEEHCSILARSAKTTYSFDLAWISNHPDTTYIYLLGTKGGVRIDREGFHFHTERGGNFRFCDTTTTYKDNTGSDDHIYKNMIAAIRGEDVRIGTTPEQALTITRLTQAAFRSAEGGGEIRLADLPDGVIDPNACAAVVKRQKELFASGAIK